jgi:hypothetical protein
MHNPIKLPVEAQALPWVLVPALTSTGVAAVLEIPLPLVALHLATLHLPAFLIMELWIATAADADAAAATGGAAGPPPPSSFPRRAALMVGLCCSMAVLSQLLVNGHPKVLARREAWRQRRQQQQELLRLPAGARHIHSD